MTVFIVSLVAMPLHGIAAAPTRTQAAFAEKPYTATGELASNGGGPNVMDTTGKPGGVNPYTACQ